MFQPSKDWKEFERMDAVVDLVYDALNQASGCETIEAHFFNEVLKRIEAILTWPKAKLEAERNFILNGTSIS